VPSATVLLYWLFYLFAGAIKIRSLYIRNFTSHEILFAMVVTNYVLALLVFALELFVPKKQSIYRLVGDDKECPGEYANIFSTMTFDWMTPLMKHGYKNFITDEDLWDLPPRALSKFVGDLIWGAWIRQKNNPGVWRTLFITYGPRYVLWMPVKMAADVLGYCQPELLRLLIQFVGTYSTDDPAPPLRGFIIAGTMFCVSLGQSIGNNNCELILLGFESYELQEC
jgi:ATP-binding cassette subfamily C (CFTR/MRP) protein 1